MGGERQMMAKCIGCYRIVGDPTGEIKVISRLGLELMK
jgi:hypothetical protein